MSRTKRVFGFGIALGLVAGSLLGCSRDQPNIVVITATFQPVNQVSAPIITALPPTVVEASPVVQLPQDSPTPDPTRPSNAGGSAQQYVVQSGDTLFAIAEANGISLESLLSVNQVIDPNLLTVGQVLNLPAQPNEATSTFKIIPDSRLIRGPGSNLFDVTHFVEQQSGYIHSAMDLVNDELLTAAEVIQRVSLEYSVDARLLLALLEYRGRWLSQTELSDIQMLYPLEQEPSPPGFDRKGLYRQLAWTANQLNTGYYGWRYRGIENIEFEDGARRRYGAGLNAGTIAVQYFLGQNTAFSDWSEAVSPNGFYQTYNTYFGNPFMGAVEPLIPPALEQPQLTLPFAQGQTWFFTGGPHGGWGSGSAWAAVDFAPPDEIPDGGDPCYVSAYPATAVATGAIVRSDSGSVVLDLDGDGDETTGWTVFYLHLATKGRVPAGTVVQPGDPVGYPSCEGGFSNGTHLHIARRYNGEWLPAACDQCAPGLNIPPFVLGGWTMYGYANQEYQGYMSNDAEQRVAEQGRLVTDNRVSW